MTIYFQASLLNLDFIGKHLVIFQNRVWKTPLGTDIGHVRFVQVSLIAEAVRLPIQGCTAWSLPFKVGVTLTPKYLAQKGLFGTNTLYCT